MNHDASKEIAKRRYRVNRQAAVWVSAAFLALGGAVVLLSSWALDPARRLGFLRSSAVDFIAREEWRQASLQLGNIVQVAPTDAEAWLELGLVQLRVASQDGGERSLQEAVQSLRRSSELAPEDPRPHRWLLEVELRTGDAVQARKDFACLAELQPDHPMLSAAWDALPSAEAESAASMAAKLNDPEGLKQAVETCRDRIAAGGTPVDPEFARIFIEALTKTHAFAERDRFMDSLSKRYPASKRVKCLRAESALLDGDLHAAIAWAAQCFEGSAAATARGVSAEACIRLAQREPAEAAIHWSRALDHLTMLIESSPNDSGSVANAALIEGERLGRIDAALARIETAIAAAEKPDAALLAAKGRLLAAAGRWAEALPFVEQAMIADPSGRNWKPYEQAVLFAGETARRRGLDGRIAATSNTLGITEAGTRQP
jgi:tetratricopeptide (TPR) repeat protein